MSLRIAVYDPFLREHSLLGSVLSWAMILAIMSVIPAALWRGDWGHVADAVCSQTARPLLCVKNKGEVVNFLHALLQLLQLE